MLGNTELEPTRFQGLNAWNELLIFVPLLRVPLSIPRQVAVESDLGVDLGFASVIFGVGNGCTFATSLCGLDCGLDGGAGLSS